MSDWTPLSPSTRYSMPPGLAYGLTDVGLVRASNEDNFLIEPALSLVLVADGMGGHHGGEVASAAVLESVRAFLARAAQGGAPQNAVVDVHAGGGEDDTGAYDPEATWTDQTMPSVITLFEAIEHANSELFARNVERQYMEGSGMGTTLTGFWQAQPDGPLLVCHVGDSRLYRYRNGELQCLTRDQTLYQQALEQGLMDKLPARNLLLQAVGPSSLIRPDVQPHAVQTGDLYLVCSDGLHGNVPHDVLAALLAQAADGGLEYCCAALIAAAKEHGSRDNITAVLLACPA